MAIKEYNVQNLDAEILDGNSPKSSERPRRFIKRRKREWKFRVPGFRGEYKQEDEEGLEES